MVGAEAAGAAVVACVAVFAASAGAVSTMLAAVTRPVIAARQPIPATRILLIFMNYPFAPACWSLVIPVIRVVPTPLPLPVGPFRQTRRAVHPGQAPGRQPGSAATSPCR